MTKIRSNNTSNATPSNYRNELLDQLNPDSNLRLFTAVAGRHEDAPLILRRNDNGSYTLGIANSDGPGGRPLFWKETSNAKNYFLTSLKQDFGPDYAAYVSAALGQMPLTAHEAHLYTCIGEFLFAGNVTPEAQLIDAVRNTRINLTQEMAEDGFAFTTVNILSTLLLRFLEFNHYQKNPDEEQIPDVILRSILSRLKLSDGTDIYTFLQRIYTNNYDNNDTYILHNFYILINDFFLNVVTMALNTTLVTNAKNIDYGYYNDDEQNTPKSVIDNISDLMKANKEVHNFATITDVVAQTALNDNSRAHVLNFAFKNHFAPALTLDFLRANVDSLFRTFKAICVGEFDLAGALLTEENAPLKSQEDRRAAATILDPFLAFQVDGAPFYTPSEKSILLAEALFDRASNHFQRGQAPGGFSLGQAQLDAVEDLKAAATALQEFASNCPDFENEALEADIRTTATLAADIVNDLAEIRMFYEQIKRSHTGAELAPFICGSALQPHLNRYISTLDERIPEDVSIQQGFFFFKITFARIAWLEGQIPSLLDEGGLLQSSPTFDWNMVAASFNQTYESSLYSELQTLPYAGLTENGFDFNGGLVNLFLDKDNSAFLEFLSNTNAFIRSTKPSILNGYSRLDKDAYVSSFKDQPSETGGALPGSVNAIQSQLNEFGLDLEHAINIWTNPIFVQGLPGPTKALMEEYGQSLKNLRSQFRDPKGPIAGLRNMVREAAEDPILFAARMNAAHEIA